MICFMDQKLLFFFLNSGRWGGKKISQLETFLKDYRVLIPDIDTCFIWSEIGVQCQKSGYTIAAMDCWIAATALR